MATYTDLYALRSNSQLKYRVQVATWVAAQAIRVEDPATANHANRMTWASQVLTFADGKAEQITRQTNMQSSMTISRFGMVYRAEVP